MPGPKVEEDFGEKSTSYQRALDAKQFRDPLLGIRPAGECLAYDVFYIYFTVLKVTILSKLIHIVNRVEMTIKMLRCQLEYVCSY